MPSDPLPLSPDEIASLRTFIGKSFPADPGGPIARMPFETWERVLATLDRQQEARTLARAEVIAEAVAELRTNPDIHFHRWCRETGSSALICLDCGSVDDHGKVRAKDAAVLAEFASHCHCDYFEDDPFAAALSRLGERE